MYVLVLLLTCLASAATGVFKCSCVSLSAFYSPQLLPIMPDTATRAIGPFSDFVFFVMDNISYFHYIAEK